MSDYTRAEAAKLSEIERLEKHVDRLSLRADMDKRRAALSKRQRDHAVEELMELIRSDCTQLSLPGMEDTPRELHVPTWQETPISVVVGEKAIVEKLAEYGINNLGQLAAYTNAEQPLTKVGLTEQQEAKVQTALEIYWQSEPGA